MAPSIQPRTNGRKNDDSHQQASHSRIKLAADRGNKGNSTRVNRDVSPSSTTSGGSRNGRKRQSFFGEPKMNGLAAHKKSKPANGNSPAKMSTRHAAKPSRQDEDEVDESEDYDETQQKLKPLMLKRGDSLAEDEQDDAESAAAYQSADGDGVYDEDEAAADQLNEDDGVDDAEDVDEEHRSKASKATAGGSRKSIRAGQQQRSPEAAGRKHAKRSSQADSKSGAAEEEDDVDDEASVKDEYVVECIQYHWFEGENKPIEFNVKWVGFSEEENTWEPESSVNETAAYDDYVRKNNIAVKSERQIKEEKEAGSSKAGGKGGRRSASGKQPKDDVASSGKRSRRVAGKKDGDKKPMGKKSSQSISSKTGKGRPANSAGRRSVRQAKKQQVVIATDWAERSRQKIEVQKAGVAQIMGFSPEESLAAKELVFGVRFDDEKETYIVSNIMMKKHYPQQLLSYYEQLVISSDPTFRKISAGGVPADSQLTSSSADRTSHGAASIRTPKVGNAKMPPLSIRPKRGTKKDE